MPTQLEFLLRQMNEREILKTLNDNIAITLIIPRCLFIIMIINFLGLQPLPELATTIIRLPLTLILIGLNLLLLDEKRKVFGVIKIIVKLLQVGCL